MKRVMSVRSEKKWKWKKRANKGSLMKKKGDNSGMLLRVGVEMT